jgi:hypothetical protein
MPNQLTNISINGQVVSVLFPFQLTLPPSITLTKVNDNTLQLTTNLAPLMPSWIPGFIANLLGTRQVTWNLDTGSISVR